MSRKLCPQSIKDFKIELLDHVLHQELDGEIVLLDVNSGDYYSLNEVGSTIWGLISEKKALSEILEVLCHEFDADASVLKSDLEAFVRQLDEAGFLVISGDGVA